MKIELPLYFNKVGSLPWESYLRVILRFTPEIDSRVNVFFFTASIHEAVFETRSQKD